MVLLLAVLPSALNLPQTNPSQTLEYAPVPPEDNSTPPAANGNFSSLSLAGRNSSTLRGDAAGAGAEAAASARGAARRPSTKRCVGNPPRQTEDKLSPPCVGYFAGDNGGATAKGVTRDEVRVLFYMEYTGVPDRSSRGAEQAQRGTYDDLGQPPDGDEFVWSRVLRIWQRYFNERFQTYGRYIHFWVYYAAGERTQGPTVERRRADAIANLKEVNPFAVVLSTGGMQEPYIELMAEKGVLTFVSAHATYGAPPQSQSFYGRHSGLLWGYDPSVETRAKVFSSWVCRQLVGGKVTFGGADLMGKPRKLGLLYPDSPTALGHNLFGKLVQKQVEDCGGRWAAIRTQPQEGCAHWCGDDSAALSNMVEFQQKGVTTVVWVAGHSQNHPLAATSLGYYPEWAQAGESSSDKTGKASGYDQSQWQNAMLVTSLLRKPQAPETFCYKTARETDPTAPTLDLNTACVFYPYIRQLFTGIQVAGPRLSAESMNRGFHAIPQLPSIDPFHPACFYETNENTCVKDAMLEWWDPAGRDPDAVSERGCWRMIEGGRRYIAGGWRSEDPTARKTSSDLCNAQIN